MPAEVRARMYVDYLIDCHIIAYESRKAYDDAVAYLADQIRTEP